MGSGAIITYDLASNLARRFTSVSTQASGVPLHILGRTYDNNSPSDSIALSADTNTLYYAALDGTSLYSLETQYLRDFSLTSQQLEAQVVEVGDKGDASDGMVMTDSNELYFGGLQQSALFKWAVGSAMTAKQSVWQSDDDLNWIDTFAFDDVKLDLLFTTNKLQKLFYPAENGGYDFSGHTANFKIFRIPVGCGSYLRHQQFLTLPGSPPTYSERTVVMLGVAVAAMLFVILMMGIYLQRRTVEMRRLKRTVNQLGGKSAEYLVMGE